MIEKKGFFSLQSSLRFVRSSLLKTASRREFRVS